MVSRHGGTMPGCPHWQAGRQARRRRRRAEPARLLRRAGRGDAVAVCGDDVAAALKPQWLVHLQGARQVLRGGSQAGRAEGGTERGNRHVGPGAAGKGTQREPLTQRTHAFIHSPGAAPTGGPGLAAR